jgi:predicted GNAT family acetyltransferase
VCREDGDVVGVAWRTPPYPIGITAVTTEQAVELARLLDLPDATMVTGPSGAARALADAMTGRRAETARIETLYRLDADGITPDSRPRPAGRTRLVVEPDVEQLAPWVLAFNDEAGGVRSPDPVARVRTGLEDGSFFVWDDGTVRCMVGGRDTGGGIARIGPVYTPPEFRGTGVASACVADVARILFDRGAETVTLYADDANRTSTGIYRRLGFRPVLSWAEHRL